MILDFLFLQGTAALDVASDSLVATSHTIDGAISALSGMTIAEVVEVLIQYAIAFGAKIIKVLLVWFIGRWVTKRLISFVKMLMERRKTNPSVQSFLSSLLDVVMLIILIVMIISIFGIDTSSFIALFASAGVAVGMALSGTLQNFAGGVIILLFRPYKVGDYIEAQGQSGTVKEIQIFNTVLQTPDNKIILVPNGPISTGIVNNYSREQLRRVDFTFSIRYGDDYNKAKTVLEKLIAADSRILKDPAPFIALGCLNSSSIDVTVRVWVNQADYWSVFFEMNKTVYEEFPKNGLNFPYQTLIVNVTKD
ncbi:MAG: mechanosensitive ion channel [Bacteroidaceae bacterium]|nr:mechanosensitive ion channel [Bacteroidaceae bacterium]